MITHPIIAKHFNMIYYAIGGRQDIAFTCKYCDFVYDIPYGHYEAGLKFHRYFHPDISECEYWRNIFMHEQIRISDHLKKHMDILEEVRK